MYLGGFVLYQVGDKTTQISNQTKQNDIFEHRLDLTRPRKEGG